MVVRWKFWLATACVLVVNAMGFAGFIRHDVPATQYEQLAQRVQFAAAGYIFHESIGFWHSGVLVAPDRVLTSAHSFDPEFTGRITRPLEGVVFGTSANPLDGPIYRVTEVVMNPVWPNQPAQHDLALLRLDRPVEGVTPARLRAINPLGQVGVSVGYGLQGDGLGGELTNTTSRLAYEAAIDYVGPEDGKMTQAVGAPPEEAANVGITLRSDFDHPDGSRSSYGSSLPRQLEGGSATGDSGGPLYIQSDRGEWFVAGILFGAFNPYEPDDDGYGNVTVWSPIFSTTNQAFLRSNDIPVVPEPATMTMALIGVLGGGVVGAIRRLC